ncbi:uncharacterized protein LOC131033358 [Cryptomeria japonica]|uniref:uncharacterized protein LOC131033358 n=1 Tax=Cryptomeria japonica TaxID=3369 RepID=UPI0025AC77D9|nr:uncharacterized protein LOC131033358 [Cryptomeria japonica]
MNPSACDGGLAKSYMPKSLNDAQFSASSQISSPLFRAKEDSYSKGLLKGKCFNSQVLKEKPVNVPLWAPLCQPAILDHMVDQKLTEEVGEDDKWFVVRKRKRLSFKLIQAPSASIAGGNLI